MLTVKDVYDYIDEIAPFCEQSEWDNSGLIIGDKNDEVHKIGVVLDITPQAIEKATQLDIDLIVSHHPVIFHPVSRIETASPIYLLAKNGIAAICAHTSLDAAMGGVNDALAAALGFGKGKPMTEQGEEKLLRLCVLDEALTATQLAGHIKGKLHTYAMLCDGGRLIKKVALCGGAGGDFIDFVAANNCDAYITGELRHHEFLAAKQAGLTAVAAGHFATENPIVAVLCEKLGAKFDVPVSIIGQKAPEITL